MAITRYCLDTSAYSNLKRGHARVGELLDRAEWVGVPSIVLGELHAGFEQGAHKDRNEAELDEFLEQAVVEEIRIDHEVARNFGGIVGALRRRGTPLPTNDIWIAAACARVGATLLTFDSHFREIPRIAATILE